MNLNTQAVPEFVKAHLTLDVTYVLNGEDPDDIPMRLARYGLMAPEAFVSEMRERMETGSDVKAEGQAAATP